ncbi:hypothetical protein AADY53_000088 [Campylobacter jejuni]
MEIINTLIKFFNSFGVFVLLGIAIIVLWILSIREKNRGDKPEQEKKKSYK